VAALRVATGVGVRRQTIGSSMPIQAKETAGADSKTFFKK
jgi:hypothetical protein